MVGNRAASPADAVLVGAGIMSTTLAIRPKAVSGASRVPVVNVSSVVPSLPSSARAVSWAPPARLLDEDWVTR